MTNTEFVEFRVVAIAALLAIGLLCGQVKLSTQHCSMRTPLQMRRVATAASTRRTLHKRLVVSRLSTAARRVGRTKRIRYTKQVG